MPTLIGRVTATWGFIGVAAPIVHALWRLTPLALTPIQEGLSVGQMAVYALWIGFMAYTEGYRGFQKRFSPMVVARTLHFAERPTLVNGLLAPAFCMGLIDATRRRLMLSWGLLIGIVLLVLCIRLVPQPWRGIVDGGVVVGLTWGLISMFAWLVAALRGKDLPVGTEIPERTTHASSQHTA